MSNRIGIFLIAIVLLLFPVPIFAANVVLNEFQIEPSGASQWAELYNAGSSAQDISGWFIDDDSGTEKFTIPTGTVLAPNNCISFQSGNFNWNAASSDSARLLSGSTLIDEYSFSGSPGPNISYGRSPDGTGNWVTFTNPTRDKLNSNGVSCLALPTPTIEPTPSSTPTPTPPPTDTPSSPTPLPTSVPPLPTSTRIPTKVPTPTKTLTPTPTLEASESAQVLSETDVVTPTPEPEVVPTNNSRPLIIAFAFIGTGLGLLALLLVLKKYKFNRQSILKPEKNDIL